jgi:hypothetical protein
MQRDLGPSSVPTLPVIVLNLGAAAAAIWIGGAIAIAGVDLTRAYLRRHRRPVHIRELTGCRPGPAQDL